MAREFGTSSVERITRRMGIASVSMFLSPQNFLTGSTRFTGWVGME
jgi:hypothetical protein